MIINVSCRTDIVAFYTDWFMNRYKEGYLDVRNPFYPSKVSRIFFNDIDAIMFCTKNPIPIVNRLKEINKPVLFHITITPYKEDIEPNVPPKGLIIDSIKKISKIVGIENIYVRYDPIFLSDKYTIEYHIKAFDNMCKILNGYVKHLIVSFIDDYKNVRNNQNKLRIRAFTEDDYINIGINFFNSVKKYGMTVQTCAEEINLIEYGFIKEECMSSNLAYRLTGKTNFKKWKARGKAPCNCVEMVDIGVYNSCKHFCKYCYANYDEKQVIDNYNMHNANSSLLIGDLNDCDVIKQRKTS